MPRIRSSSVLTSILIMTLLSSASAQTSESYDFAAALSARGLHERAVPAWRQYLEGEPRGKRADNARFQLAESLFQLEKLKEARTAFKKFLATGPKEFRREGQFRLGATHARLGDHSQAIASLEAVTKKTGDDLWVAATYVSAESLLKLDKLKEAQLLYAAILKAPNNEGYRANAALSLGFLAYDAGDFEEALRQFELVGEKPCENAIRFEAMFMSGQALFDLDRLELADQAFVQTIDSGAKDFLANSWVGRGRIRIRMGRLAEGIAFFRKAIDLGAEDIAGRAMIREAARLHEEKKTEDGLSLLDGVPTSVQEIQNDLAYWKGVLASEGGQSEAGLKELRKALSGNDSPDRRYRLADALMRSKRFQDAAQNFKKIDRDGVDPSLRWESRYSRAFCLSQLGNHKDAARILATMDRDEIPNGLRLDATFARAENLFAIKKFQAAHQVYQSVEKRSQDPDLISRSNYKMGWCAFRIDDFEQALGHFRTISSAAGRELHLESNHMVARCLEKLGRGTEAKKVHETVVAGSLNDDRHGARSLLILAEEARKDENFEEARSRYMALKDRSIDPATSASLLFGLAAVEANLKNLKEAARTYEEFLRQNPEDSRADEARIGLGWALYRAGQLVEARAVCSQKLGSIEAEGERYFLSGLIEIEDKNHKAAARWLLPVATFSPAHRRSVEARLLAGQSLAKSGQTDKAIEQLRRYAQSPENPEDGALALYELAFAYLEMKNDADAEQSFLAITRKYPASRFAADSAFRLGEKFYERSEWAKALQSYVFCVEASSQSQLIWKAQYKAAWSLKNLERYEEAAKRFVAATTNGGALEAESLFQAASCRIELGEDEASLDLFQRLQKKHPRHELSEQAGQKVITLLGKLGRHKEVLRRASSTLDAKSRDAWSLEAWSTVGDSARAINMHSTAIRAYRHVAEYGAKEDAARARYFAAISTQVEKGEEAAVDAFLKVPIFHDVPSYSSQALAQAAGILEKLKRPKEALKIWRNVLKDFPKSPSAKAAKSRIRSLESKEN